MRLPAFLLLLAMLLPCAPLTQTCRAQDTSGEEPDRYRFSGGMAFGLSATLGSHGLVPGSPVPLTDSASARSGFAALASILLTDEVAVELAIDDMLLGASTFTLVDQEGPELVPGYFTTRYIVPAQALVTASAGLSYRWRLGRFSLEPALMAGRADVDSSYSSISLKGKGTSEYRTITHRMGDGHVFVLLPVLTLRYGFGDAPSRWGAILRTSYVHASFDLVHAITETILEKTVRDDRFMTRHVVDAVNVEAGLYYYFF